MQDRDETTPPTRRTICENPKTNAERVRATCDVSAGKVKQDEWRRESGTNDYSVPFAPTEASRWSDD